MTEELPAPDTDASRTAPIRTAMRFEQRAPAPSFVEIELHEATLWRTWGRIGTAGTRRAESHGDAVEAARALESQGRRLERKGYSPGRQNLDFIAAIVANPDDTANYLVYSDWLLEQRDPRGELIALMAASLPFEERLAAHRCELAPAWWRRCEPVWRLGFVQKMVCHGYTGALLRRLFRHPSLMVLEELVVTETGPGTLEGWRAALAARPAALRKITMSGMAYLAPLRDEIPELVL